MENQGLAKREEYISKRKQKEELKLRQFRAKKFKKFALIGVLGVIAIAGIAFGVSSLSGKDNGSSGGAAKMEISPKEYDAGTVSMEAGLVKKNYEIKNTGDGDLKISNINTSCHCTTAILTMGDVKSPAFGMGVNNWSQEIAPGQTADLEVTFDPNYHGPSAIGPVVRAVWFSTNDPQTKKAEVRLIADVIH